DALEDAAKHVGRDAGAVASLGDHEMKVFEQVVERVAPEGVRNVAAERPLQRVRLEQPAIQKGNGAEPSGASGPLGGRPVEGTEEKGAQQVAVDPAPP